MRLEPDPGIEISECDQVYPPREDSLLLLRHVEVEPGERVLDMGTGTGIIALHCAKARTEVTAVDLNPHAASCAEANARKNHLEMQVVQSDLFLDVEGEFDVMAFNPPYVPDDIRGTIERSWAGGEDGVRVLERFLREAPRHLAPGGRIYVLLSSVMRDAPLQCVLSQYRRERLGSQRLFFEEIWVERLALP